MFILLNFLIQYKWAPLTKYASRLLKPWSFCKTSWSSVFQSSFAKCFRDYRMGWDNKWSLFHAYHSILKLGQFWRITRLWDITAWQNIGNSSQRKWSATRCNESIGYPRFHYWIIKHFKREDKSIESNRKGSWWEWTCRKWASVFLKRNWF